MTHLWERIQAYMDEPRHTVPLHAADVARLTGVSDQLLSKWKKKPTLPEPDQLSAVTRGTGIPYLELLVAGLRDRGYIEAGDGRALRERVSVTALSEPTGKPDLALAADESEQSIALEQEQTNEP